MRNGKGYISNLVWPSNCCKVKAFGTNITAENKNVKRNVKTNKENLNKPLT